MKPWVGEYYKYGFLGYNDQGKIIEGIKEHPGHRILILADSILVQPEETLPEGSVSSSISGHGLSDSLTSELIQAYINLSKDKMSFFKSFKHIIIKCYFFIIVIYIFYSY